MCAQTCHASAIADQNQIALRVITQLKILMWPQTQLDARRVLPERSTT
jgi:hypothetical protein